MANWTHNVCAQCWHEWFGDRTPYAMIGSMEQRCCFCGTPTTAGIYIRHDPAEMPCMGMHYMFGGP